MAKNRKKNKNRLWSVTRIKDPRYPGYTIRITEFTPGGNLYAVRVVNGRQKGPSLGRTRADLGATAREQETAARALALEIIEKLAKGSPSRTVPASVAEVGETLTLGRLVDLYELRGSLTAQPKYRAEQTARVRKVVAYMGAERPVVSLSPSDVDDWVQHRREQCVRQGTIAGDIAALKIALNWATAEKRPDGRPLVDTNPLARVRVEKERNPRRPRADADRYRALRAAVDQLPNAFGLVLDLCWETGHRIGAIRGLRWEHVYFDATAAAAMATDLDSDFGWAAEDFLHGGIRFYAGERGNNKRHDHVSPITPAAREALERARAERPAIAGWVLPAPKDPAQPVDYHTLKQWMRRAEKLAGVPHLTGGIWHPFRRGWATARKRHPAQDVAKLGGWFDVPTMQKSYQQADGLTIRTIVSGG